MDELAEYRKQFDYDALVTALNIKGLTEVAQGLFDAQRWQELFDLALEEDLEDLAHFLYRRKSCVLPLRATKKFGRFIPSQEPHEVTAIVGVHEGLHLEIGGKEGQALTCVMRLCPQSRYGRYANGWGWAYNPLA